MVVHSLIGEFMACAPYYVSKGESAWKIRVGNSDFNYSSQAMAMNAALTAAVRSSASGYDAEVLTQGEDGYWHTEGKYTRHAAGPSNAS
jgi:hypothetical protein